MYEFGVETVERDALRMGGESGARLRFERSEVARTSFELCIDREKAAGALFNLVRGFWSESAISECGFTGSPFLSCSLSASRSDDPRLSLTVRIVVQISRPRAANLWSELDLASVLRAKMDSVLATIPGVLSVGSAGDLGAGSPGAMAVVVPRPANGFVRDLKPESRKSGGLLPALLSAASRATAEIEFRYCSWAIDRRVAPGGASEIWVGSESLERVFGTVDALIGSVLPSNCAEVDFFADRSDFGLDREDLLAARAAQKICELIPLAYSSNAVKVGVEGRLPDWYRTSKRKSPLSLAFGQLHGDEGFTDAASWIESRWMPLESLASRPMGRVRITSQREF